MEAKKIGRRLRYSLTEKGEAAYLKMLIRQAKERRDGKMLVVLFDIPEREKSSRTVLRHFLKSSGFTRLQWSVWTSYKEVAEALGRWVRIRRLGKWVRILKAEAVRG